MPAILLRRHHQSKRLDHAGRGRLPPSLEPLLELDANLLRSNTRAPLACEGQNLHKRNINARVHVGTQITPRKLYRNFFRALFAIHCVSRRRSSAALKTKVKRRLDRRSKSIVHLQ